MPISNPLLIIQTIGAIAPTVATTDPTAPPSAIALQWFNSVSKDLFLSVGTATVADWAKVTAQPQPLDVAALFGRIVVANGAVVTDGENVVFE